MSDPTLTMISLPSEIIDHIVSFLSKSADLASVSRTCKLLHSIVVPDHLHWRSIGISAMDLAVLRLLNENSRGAQQVQRLRIGLKHFRSTPIGYYNWNLDKGNFKLDEHALQSAAGYLYNLETLHLEVRYNLHRLRGFLLTLRAQAAPFTKLSVWLGPLNYHTAPHISDEISVVAELGGFTHVEWHSDDDMDDGLFPVLVDMLSRRCPQLEKLGIEMETHNNEEHFFEPHHASSPYLWSARWPRLRSLQLLRVRIEHATGSFLNEHPQLEVLSLEETGESTDPPFWLSAGALPNLRELWWRYGENVEEFLKLLRPLPDGRRRPLTVVSPLVRSESETDSPLNAEQFDDFCRSIVSLPELSTLGCTFAAEDYIHVWHTNYYQELGKAGRASPVVTDLLLRLAKVWWWDSRVLEVLIPALRHFPSLRKIHFFDDSGLSNSTNPQKHWNAVLAALGAGCEGVQHVNGWVKSPKGIWIPPPVRTSCPSCMRAPHEHLESREQLGRRIGDGD